MTAHLGQILNHVKSYWYPEPKPDITEVLKDELAETESRISELESELNDLRVSHRETEEKLKLYKVMVDQLFDIVLRKDRLLVDQEKTIDRLFKIISGFMSSVNQFPDFHPTLKEAVESDLKERQPES